jgi:hypothetical protein
LTRRRRQSEVLDDTQTVPGAPFEIAPSLAAEGDDTGSVRLGPFERHYESLFAEALASGEISAQERKRLDLAARSLGLDASRVAALEQALLDAWESDVAETLVEPQPDTLADRAPSSMAPPRGSALEDEPPTLARPRHRKKLRRREGSPEIPFRELHARYHAATRAGAVDDAWRIAEVLQQRGAATADQRAFWEERRQTGPIRPRHPLDADGWSLLSHEGEDKTTGEIFGVIASAALLGRVSAMRRDGLMPRIDADSYQNPLTSTLTAVRALSWAAATLGLRAPPAYAAPEQDAGFEILTIVPPSTRIGARALSGWTAAQLAFTAGRHLSWFREEHFVCTLVPSVAYLESIFYAALLLGAPSLQLGDDVRERARAFSQAIVPCLEQPQIERLRRLVARFLARGGRTNLKHWVRGAEWTACRAGLLLCGELSTAADMLTNEPGAEARITELETFWASEAAGELRRKLGVALG